MSISPELKAQVEAAFDFRGHVTVTLKNGGSIEGFLYNRQFADGPNSPLDFVDLIIRDKDERRRIPLDGIRSIALTGEDCAAGKSYAEYLEKKKKAA